MSDNQDSALPSAQASSFMVDPNFADSVETEYDIPAVGNPTDGPNRYTVHVPTDDAVLSLGQASTRWINDTGITGRTKSHVHFHAKENETMVSLGGKTNEGFEGYKGNVLGESTGFSMVTAGASWLDSAGQMYIASGAGDVILRAAKAGAEGGGEGGEGGGGEGGGGEGGEGGEEGAGAGSEAGGGEGGGEGGGGGGGEGPLPQVLIQSDAGHIQMTAKEKITVAGNESVRIFSKKGTAFADPGYKGAMGMAIHEEFDESRTQQVTKALNALSTVQVIGSSVADLAAKYPKGKASKHGWAMELATEAPKLLLELVELKGMFFKPVKEGEVAIYGESEVGITSPDEVSIFGGKGASMASGRAAGLFGAIGAGVKGGGYASLWSGLISSIMSVKDVSIRALLGEAKISGKKEVSISSEGAKGEIKITAKELVQIFSDGHATLAAKHWAYVAADNFGMKAEKEKVVLGELTSPEDHKAAKLKHGITIKPNYIAANCEAGSFIISETTGAKLSVENGGTVMQLKGGDLKLNGTAIKIG